MLLYVLCTGEARSFSQVLMQRMGSILESITARNDAVGRSHFIFTFTWKRIFQFYNFSKVKAKKYGKNFVKHSLVYIVFIQNGQGKELNSYFIESNLSTLK